MQGVTANTRVTTPYLQQTSRDLSKLEPVLTRPIEPKVLSGDLMDCHSSTQVEINAKHFVAFKGRRPDEKTKDIWIKCLQSGHIYSEPSKLVSVQDKSKNAYSPIFSKHRDGFTYLFYRLGPSPDKLTSHLKSSVDGTNFIDEDFFLGRGIIGPTKTKPFQTKDGELLLGSSTEEGAWTFDGTKQGITACHIEIFPRYRDGKWIRLENLQMPDGYDQKRGGAIEPTLFAYGDKGEIGLLCRNRNRWVNGAPQENGKGGWALFSVSKDGGRTWSQLEESTLRNPDTSLDIVDLGKGKLIVFYNDSHESRDRLSFALSSNGGVTWSDPCLLVEKEGEFPSAIMLENKQISVTYADKKGQLNHITIDPRDIQIDGNKWC